MLTFARRFVPDLSELLAQTPRETSVPAPMPKASSKNDKRETALARAKHAKDAATAAQSGPDAYVEGSKRKRTPTYFFMCDRNKCTFLHDDQNEYYQSVEYYKDVGEETIAEWKKDRIPYKNLNGPIPRKSIAARQVETVPKRSELSKATEAKAKKGQTVKKRKAWGTGETMDKVAKKAKAKPVT